jgi:transcriptional regulator with XRE-family HTH domain
MPITLKDKMKELSPAQRKKVEARAAELIAEEMTLRELRHARKLTQVKMAKTLGVTQDSVSRLEKRSDLLLSTLRKAVEAMGGNLSLVAEFPDRAPVVLAGIAEESPRQGHPAASRTRTLERAAIRSNPSDVGEFSGRWKRTKSAR